MPTVTLYETNADNLILGRDGEAWNLGPTTPDMAGLFAIDAYEWLAGNWDPSEIDGQTPGQANGLTAVAEYDMGTGLVRWLVDRPGGAARLYVGPAAALTEH